MARSTHAQSSFKDAGVSLRVVLSLTATCWLLVGCGKNTQGPSAAKLARFKMDIPAGPAVDVTEIVKARVPSGPYRVVSGDILQFEMPRVVDPQPMASGVFQAAMKQTHTCRVGDDGAIVLPVVGPIVVEGKSLAAIERAVAAAYYPKYVKTTMPVYVSILEYKRCRVSIVGAVAKPGVYDLRHDQMSLVALLMEAGNIVDEGAALIRISQGGGEKQSVPTRPSGSSDRLVHTMAQPAEEAGRLVFEPEGPLWTTGWLTVERKGHPALRRWLDLANEPQRQMFLQAARRREHEADATDLKTKLVHLAGHLKSDPEGSRSDLTVMQDGWRVAERGRFTASLQGSGDRESAANGNAMGRESAEAPTSILLPVKGLNIPFTDVALTDGASVTVGRPYEQSIVIVGLVNRPGLMPYPLDARYTLIQAIAYAGGLNMVADPRHVSVYRLQADGTVEGVTVQLVNPKQKQELTQAMNMVLRPGDVVSVENTMRTRTNLFLDRVFRISLGLYVTPETLWNGD